MEFLLNKRCEFRNKHHYSAKTRLYFLYRYVIVLGSSCETEISFKSLVAVGNEELRNNNNMNSILGDRVHHHPYTLKVKN